MDAAIVHVVLKKEKIISCNHLHSRGISLGACLICTARIYDQIVSTFSNKTIVDPEGPPETTAPHLEMIVMSSML